MTDAPRGAALRAVLTPEQAIEAIEASHDHVVLLYKHSPVCDLSARALDEMNAFLAQAPTGLDARMVDVLAARPASQWIEARSGVRHESPQALILSRGEVIWNASHRAIRAAALNEALARSSGR